MRAPRVPERLDPICNVARAMLVPHSRGYAGPMEGDEIPPPAHGRYRLACVCARTRGGAPEFFRGLASALDACLKTEQGALLLVTAGVDGEGTAAFLLAGPDALVAAASAPVAEALQGRGGGRGDRYQGKCNKVSRREAAAAAALAALDAQ